MRRRLEWLACCDWALSGHRWWRRLRGGRWYSVTPYFAWYMQIWVTDGPHDCERVNCVEEW